MENLSDLQNADNELELQFGYAKRVKQLLEARCDSQPLAFVHTYGCQQNVSDSERLKGLLELMGYGFTDDLSAADLVLYNTCAVREHAEDRVFGNVGLLKACKRKKPEMTVIVCGCMAQQASVADKIKRSYPYVDILFGTHVRHRLPEFVYRRLTGEGRIFENPDKGESVIEGVPLHRDGTFKAWLPIMQGCNNFCTYCIVPYVRGREHSREQSDVLSEAERLIASGAKEIMLLGQNVNSYGKGNAEKTDFASLLRAVNALPGDFRIRFMTSHPKDCSEELLLAMSECGKVERHLHLPVQCGSDRLLKIMNRHYDTEKYMSLIKRARELMPDISFTSDIIVGFPDERDADFEGTVDLVKKVGYYSLFTFIYSKRPGTPAAEMPDPVTKSQKSERFARLLKVQEEISVSINRSLIGKKVRLLIDDTAGEGMLSGRSSENYVVKIAGSQDEIGTFADAVITGFDGVLHGERI